MSIKTRAKIVSISDVATIVDLLLENKPKLFGALSSTLTSDEKNNKNLGSNC